MHAVARIFENIVDIRQEFVLCNWNIVSYDVQNLAAQMIC